MSKAIALLHYGSLSATGQKALEDLTAKAQSSSNSRVFTVLCSPHISAALKSQGKEALTLKEFFRDKAPQFDEIELHTTLLTRGKHWDAVQKELESQRPNFSGFFYDLPLLSTVQSQKMVADFVCQALETAQPPVARPMFIAHGGGDGYQSDVRAFQKLLPFRISLLFMNSPSPFTALSGALLPELGLMPLYFHLKEKTGEQIREVYGQQHPRFLWSSFSDEPGFLDALLRLWGLCDHEF